MRTPSRRPCLQPLGPLLPPLFTCNPPAPLSSHDCTCVHTLLTSRVSQNPRQLKTNRRREALSGRRSPPTQQRSEPDAWLGGAWGPGAGLGDAETVRPQRKVPGRDGTLRAGGRHLSPPPDPPPHTALPNLAASPTCPAVLRIPDWPDRVSQLLAPPVSGLISRPFEESFFFTWK